MINLLKTFDYLSHEFTTANLNAYGSALHLTKFIHKNS